MLNLKNCLRKTIACLVSIIMLFGSGTAFARPLNNPGIGYSRPDMFHHRPFHGKQFYKRRFLERHDTFLPPLFRGLTYIYLASLAKRQHEPTVIVVPAPAANTSYSPGNTLAINIPNSNGSYTQVTLTKSGDGYLGPQGEYYIRVPSVEQLRVLYAK